MPWPWWSRLQPFFAIYEQERKRYKDEMAAYNGGAGAAGTSLAYGRARSG